MNDALPKMVVASYRAWNPVARKWEDREEACTVIPDPMAGNTAYVRVRFDDGREVNLPPEAVKA